MTDEKKEEKGSKVFTIRVPTYLWKRLKSIAQKERRSVNNLVNKALAEAVDDEDLEAGESASPADDN